MDSYFRGTLERFYAEDSSIPWIPFETDAFRLKKYVRSAAGSQRPPANLIRTPQVLFKCTATLVETTLKNIECKDALLYFLDRSRAIRQDFTLQSEWVESNSEAKTYMENSLKLIARFLVYEGSKFRDEDSTKHLDDGLSACLSALSSNLEFSLYQEILYGGAVSGRPPMGLVEYARDGLWVCCLREFDQAPLLQRFAASRRLIPDMQLRSIAALNAALHGRYSIEFVTSILRFHSKETTESVLRTVGLDLVVEEGDGNRSKTVTFKKSQGLKVNEFVGERIWRKPLAMFKVETSLQCIRAAIFEGIPSLE